MIINYFSGQSAKPSRPTCQAHELSCRHSDGFRASGHVLASAQLARFGNLLRLCQPDAGRRLQECHFLRREDVLKSD